MRLVFANCPHCMKENIEKVGQMANGLGIYTWEYKPEFKSIAGFGKQFGVMAQEVEKVFPELVFKEITSWIWKRLSIMKLFQFVSKR